jgi:peptidoglycan LD-endopeptidase CwlK
MSFRNMAMGAVCAVCVASSGYVFSQRSVTNLRETHIDLQRVTECALNNSPVDFVVVDGRRTAKEHLINVANGRSWIKRSRHQDGAAIDIAAWNGKVTYDHVPYHLIASVFSDCSHRLNIPIIWGGNWKVKDLMHFELDRRMYP